MRKADIFMSIINIMQNDSSTCKDKGVGDYKK